MPDVLKVDGLRKIYGEFELSGISFSLPPGYIMGFIGANGAGKTTTIKLIMNLIDKDGGTVEVLGRDHIQEERTVKDKIGFVYDNAGYYDELTMEQMKRIIARYYTHWDENTYREYLKRLGLPENKKIGDLSKGMRMKYALALALSHHAELLLMDEPTSGLDPVIRSELLGVLQEVIEDGKCSVFFSTHITSDLDKVADYVVMIHEGKMVFNDTKDHLLEHYRLVKGSKRHMERLGGSRLIGTDRQAHGFSALVSDGPAAAKAAGEGLILEKPTLEDMMLYHVRDASGRQA
jgi:ABC-2 type transport system ATP-binding protein